MKDINYYSASLQRWQIGKPWVELLVLSQSIWFDKVGDVLISESICAICFSAA